LRSALHASSEEFAHMKNLALGALLVGCFACGGGDTQLLDAGDPAGLACNPMLQTGCKAGEKCTWLVLADTPTRLGQVACMPDGSVPVGGDCTTATAAGGGVDTCVAGTLCVSRKCKPICDPQLVEGSAMGACPINFSCSLYEGFFSNGSGAIAGVCEPACDPLTQKLKVGTANLDACGSLTPAAPTSTCVRGPGFRTFACAPSGPDFYAKTDRMPPETAPSGAPYPNGCAPGFIPFYFEDASGTMKTLCSGLCAPLKVDRDIAGTAGHEQDNRGDKTALGKLPTDPMPLVGKSTCDEGVKGSKIDNPRGEDCRFLWYPLAGGDPNKAANSPYNDTLGVCFAYEKFKTVRVPNMAELQAQKSCADLEALPRTGNPYLSAKENGCYPLSQSRGFRKRPDMIVNYRLANSDEPLLRHAFD
jgi:hypothetical protein